MTYLVSTALRCANGMPTEMPFEFLGQTQSLPYMRTFTHAPVSLAELRAECVNALREAAATANWQPETWGKIPLFVGSTAYTISAHEREPDLVADFDMNTLSRGFAPFGEGICENYATSCTSAAQALLQAHGAILSGECERALVLGVESYNLLTLMHFFSLNLLANEYRPFHGNGFILGEGVAALALEKSPHSGCLKLRAIAANTSSADLAATPATSLLQVMRQTLQRAKMLPQDIAAIKTHGVGTQASDEAEAAALAELFHPDVPRWAFKPQTGHTLGACGAIETAILAQQMTHFPPHIAVLANYFGFGGNNVCMIWEKMA